MRIIYLSIICFIFIIIFLYLKRFKSSKKYTIISHNLNKFVLNYKFCFLL